MQLIIEDTSKSNHFSLLCLQENATLQDLFQLLLPRIRIYCINTTSLAPYIPHLHLPRLVFSHAIRPILHSSTCRNNQIHRHVQRYLLLGPCGESVHLV